MAIDIKSRFTGISYKHCSNTENPQNMTLCHSIQHGHKSWQLAVICRSVLYLILRWPTYWTTYCQHMYCGFAAIVVLCSKQQHLFLSPDQLGMLGVSKHVYTQTWGRRGLPEIKSCISGKRLLQIQPDDQASPLPQGRPQQHLSCKPKLVSQSWSEHHQLSWLAVIL